MLAPVLAGAIFICTPIAVYDGDTLTCSSGVRVRLAAIDAPELRGCNGRRGRICVPGDGRASRKALADMVRGRTLKCTRTGTSYKRIVARCYAGGVDLSCAMLALEAAVILPRYSRGVRCP